MEETNRIDSFINILNNIPIEKWRDFGICLAAYVYDAETYKIITIYKKIGWIFPYKLTGLHKFITQK